MEKWSFETVNTMGRLYGRLQCTLSQNPGEARGRVSRCENVESMAEPDLRPH